MKLGLAMVCALGSATVLAGDWRASLTTQPGKFPLPRPCQLTYRFGWTAFTAATADADFSRTKNGHLRLAMKTKTIGAVRTLWQLDAQHVATCDATTLRPLRLFQSETYKTETECAKVIFRGDEVERLLEKKPPGDTPAKTKLFKLPNPHHLQSALLFVRSQRLLAGDVYRFVVFPAKSGYLAEVQVLGRETLKVKGRSGSAIKCEVQLQGITKNLELEPHPQFKLACAWLSDDRDRLLLKIDADTFVGNEWAELEAAQFTQMPR